MYFILFLLVNFWNFFFKEIHNKQVNIFKRNYVFKTYGRKLFYIYGGSQSKINNNLKAEKEKLYKYGDHTLGIFYYGANFNNMISIFFRISGVILFFLSLVFITVPFLFLWSSFLFFDFEFLFFNFFNDFFFINQVDTFFLEKNQYFFNYEFIFLFFFKYIFFLFFFSFCFHVLKRVYILFEFYGFNKMKNSGYNHYLVRGY